MPKSFEELRDRALAQTKEEIKLSYESEEHALVHAVKALEDIVKSHNLAYERLSEWYGIYYPELIIASPKLLADLALVLNDHSNISKDAIIGAVKDEQRSLEIYKKASSTMGRRMNDDEKEALLSLAKALSDLGIAMSIIENYISKAAKKIMPNTSYLVETNIAAELLSKAGSMERLATMPAGTIQLLGAEKALFKHIKFGSKPPKYGILFKLPVINAAQKSKRGKIARAYAAKISIALKADHFSKNFVADKLKESLDKRIKEISSGSSQKRKGIKGR